MQVIFQVRAVGGADLFQLGPRARHDVGQAESATDLDQFPTRHYGLAALGGRVEDEQHRRGVIVDDGEVFGAS